MELRDAARIGQGRTAEVYAWGEGRVLKLFHDRIPPSWVEHEARVTAAVHRAGAPAPQVFGLEQVAGRHGFVMQRVDGPSLLEVLRRSPWRLAQAARRLAEVQAALHALSVRELPSLDGVLRWRIAEAALPERVRSRAEAALDRLPAGERLCHSDLHPDNVIVTSGGLRVIDWSEAASGNPLADVARTALTLQISHPVDRPLGPLVRAGRGVLRSTYLRRSLRLAAADRQALAAWMLPVAAARAGHRIEEERPALEALLSRLAA